MTEHRLRALVRASSRLLRSELHDRIRADNGSGGTDSTRARRRARETRLMLERLGPFYIKFGQMLSTRPDIVSEAMIQELGTLHDSVSAEPFAVFEPVLRKELGDGWHRRFREVDTTRPLGSASLAQVYGATLPDGQQVVVKIQRPGVASVVTQDMALMRRIARLVTRAAPRFTDVIDVNAILGILFDAMRPELDFTREAHEMNEARPEVAEFKHLDVPEVLLATPRVMIQARAPGCSIRDADPTRFSTDERLAIGRDLLVFMYRSYFTTKVFHADPHPGNIFVHPGEKASLIDWGMVGRVDRSTALGLLLTLTNLALNDGHGLARTWIDMGHVTARADIPAFQSDMAALVPRIVSASLETLNFGVTLTAVLASASKHGIRTSPVVGVLGKSFANLEGSIRYLAPELSITDTFNDAVTDIMRDVLEDTISEPQLARTVLETITMGSNLIQQTHGILRDLATGQLSFRIPPSVQPKKLHAMAYGALALYLWRKRDAGK